MDNAEIVATVHGRQEPMIPASTRLRIHRSVLAAGMKPDAEPEKRPSGNREFVLRDPDGYKLAFFQKK